MKELYWLQQDLRLQDNPALLSHCDASELLLVYIWQQPPAWCNLTGLGSQRRRLLLEHLHSLHGELQARGQNLLFLQGAPAQLLPALVEQWGIDRVGTSRCPGVYEARTLAQLRERLPVPLQVHGGNTLLLQHQLPGGLRALPRAFPRFLQGVEALPVTAVLDAPATLPPAPAGLPFPPLPEVGGRPPAALPLRGGSAAGQRRLQQYLFGEEQILDYPVGRNTLDPLAGSSTLSPWLASGALSVRELAHGITHFEQSRQRSEATGQLRRALWRREFFHWRALLDGHRLFRAAGLDEPAARKHRFCTFDPRAFARWCQGDTDYPLVNALQRQLLATGWMSHSGRQLSASCLINELGLDWRFGAAFFEKHLIDYEVGSNYGNWQYLAGVGGDPGGGRHFNLAEQAAEHDPGGVFTAKWDGDRPAQPEFAMDAADWPLSPPAAGDDQEPD